MVKFKDLLVYGAVTSTISASLLFFAIGERSYGYYQFLRVAVSMSAVLVAYVGYIGRVHLIVVLASLLAILFNPISPLSLDKTTWQDIDMVAGILFLAFAITFIWEWAKNKQRS